MNRPLKFRAWDKEKQMMYVPKKDQGNLSFFHVITSWMQNENDIPIMQFTGLYDKNGKEIYEGDILEYVGHKCPCCWKEIDITKNLYYKIRWDGEWAGFEAEEMAIGSICQDEWTTSMEVVGNIFQNKDLLNDKPNDTINDGGGE